MRAINNRNFVKLLEVPFQCKGYDAAAAGYILIIIIHKWEQPSIYKGCFGKKEGRERNKKETSGTSRWKGDMDSHRP